MYTNGKLKTVIFLTLSLFAIKLFGSNECGYLKFNGRPGSTTGSYARTDTGAAFTFQTTNFTIEAWLMPQDTVTEQAILLNGSCDIACPSIYLGIGNSDPTCKGSATNRSRFAFGMVNSSGKFFEVKQNSRFKANEWIHVAVTYDGSMIRMYINGMLEDSVTANGTPELSKMRYLMVGSEPGLNCGGVGGRFSYLGNLDELRIWHSTRTKSEIYSNMDKYLPDTQSSLRAYFHFNDDLSGRVAYSSTSKDKMTLNATLEYMKGGRSPEYSTPKFAIQPQTIRVCHNQSRKLVAGANKTGYSVSYQWYFLNGGKAYSLIDTGGYNGATNDTLTVSNSIAPLNYFVKISGPCSEKAVFSDTVTIILLNLPVISLSDSAHFCEGSSLVIKPKVSGDISYTYKWSNGSTKDSLSVNDNGSYSLTVEGKDGCIAKDSIYVKKHDLPIVNITGQNDVVAGTKVVLRATGAKSYLWNTGVLTDSLVVTPDTTTTYSVTGTSVYGCKNTASFKLNVKTSKINRLHGYVAITTYPNPVVETLSLDLSNINTNEPLDIKVLNLEGKVLLNGMASHSTQSTILDVSQLPKGYYFLKVVSNSKVYTSRFLKL